MKFPKVIILLWALFITTQLSAQTAPGSLCSPSGGTNADIIGVSTAYRGPGDPAPTFVLPPNTLSATITLSSHNSVYQNSGSSSAAYYTDEDFITATILVDFENDTYSGILNYAQSTQPGGSETNLYSWVDVPLGVNVTTQISEGQITVPALNELTVSLNSGILTVSESNNNIHTSYLVEWMSPLGNSLNVLDTDGMLFTNGATTQTLTLPTGTDLIIINKKGTVGVAQNSSSGGTEEGYADGRIIIDVNAQQINGFLTVGNGADLSFRSTYCIANHPTNNSTQSVITAGNVIGDYQNKSYLNNSTNAVGIADPTISISGNTLTFTRNSAYAAAFDDAYVVEYYHREGTAMSASFIASKSSFIAVGEGTTSGTAKTIDIPTGSDFVVIRQAGNANNSKNGWNENPLAGYYFLDLKTETATGFLWQQVGWGSSTVRRDDNYRFAHVPLDGTSTRDPAYSSGIYSNNSGAVYDVRFELSPDKSKLIVTNSFAYVAAQYQALLVASFYGKKTDLSGTVTVGQNNSPDYIFENNGNCGEIKIDFSVCNPGSGNSAGGFPVSLYDKDPTADGTARLIDVATFVDPIPSQQCETETFTISYNHLNIPDPNQTYYAILNDDGRNASGGIGTAVGSPFDLEDLEGQNPNYIECDYTNNLIPLDVTGVMDCPTVDFLVTSNVSPTVTGTWDSQNTQTNGLTVIANGTTYTLGTDPELTVSGNNWSLQLTNLNKPSAHDIEVTTVNSKGDVSDNTTGELIITDQGFVLRDINGQSDNSINGVIIDTVNNTQLYLNIIDVNANEVIESSPVTNGSYSVVNLANLTGDFKYQLTVNPGTEGSAPPATALSGDFVYTAEGTTATGDGNPDGEFDFTITTANQFLAVNFGIQRKPHSGDIDITGVIENGKLLGTYYTPAHFGDFVMPSNAFLGSDDGNISEVLLTALSADVLFVRYSGVEYYRQSSDIPAGCGSPNCVVFPASGLVMSTTAGGILQQPLYVGTVDNFIDGSVVFDYKVKDNANFYSDNTAQVEVPFIALKYTSGGGWENGSDGSGQPNETDGNKTLFWIDDGGTLTVDAVVQNLIIYPGVDAEIASACLTVDEDVENQGGKLVMTAITDANYGQYLGPSIEATFNMQLEYGWHNVAFPTDATVQDLLTENNTLAEPFTIQIDPLDLENTNLQYYDTEVSGGKEMGFYIQRGGQTYSSHAYGTFNAPALSDHLRDRGYHLFFDEFFHNTDPVSLNISGLTNDQSYSYNTHNNFGGWNLIPNPYPVTLSTKKMWDDGFFGSGENEYDKAIFIWNPGDPHFETVDGKIITGAYLAFDPENGVIINTALGQTVEGDVLISPFQSFYIRRSSANQTRRLDVDGTNNLASLPDVAIGATTDPALPASGTGSGSTQTVTIKPTYREACTKITHYKTNNTADVIVLKVTDQKTQLSDAFELAFAGHYTDGFDKTFDIQKFGSDNREFPVFFSMVDGKALVINKMAIPDFTKTVPLGFSSAKAEHQFKIEANHNPESYTLYLEDLKTGAWHNLNTGAYTFKNDVSFDINRFKLHFNNGSRDIEQGAKIIAFHDGEMLNVVFEQLNTPQANVMITDVVGRVLYQKENVATNGALQIPNLKSGEAAVYIVHVSAGSFADAVKVVF